MVALEIADLGSARASLRMLAPGAYDWVAGDEPRASAAAPAAQRTVEHGAAAPVVPTA